MKIDRELKKRAAVDHKKILEENEAFLKSVLEEQYPGKTNKPKQKTYHWKRFVLGSVATAAAVIIAVVTRIFLCLPDSGNSNDKKEYLQENFVIIDTNLADLNSTAQSISFNLENYCLETLSLCYDSISGDKLYYFAEGRDEEGIEEWELTVVVNDGYNAPFVEDKYIASMVFNGNAMIYYTYTIDDDGIYLIITNALIEFEKENLFVEYTCIAFAEDENTFFNWLESVIFMK